MSDEIRVLRLAHTLAREKSGIQVEYGPYAFRARPEHALHIAAVIGSWAFAYTDIAKLFAHLLGTESQLAFQLLRSIQNERTQERMLDDAATERLQGRERAVCLAILSRAKGARKVRSAYAHALWGWSEDLPDKILRVNADDWLVGLSEQSVRTAKITPKDMPGLPSISIPQNRITVLSERDIQRDVYRMTEIIGLIRRFWLIRDPRLMGFGDVVSKRERAQLMRELWTELDAQASARPSPKTPRRNKP